jgi:hypothetical protein
MIPFRRQAQSLSKIVRHDILAVYAQANLLQIMQGIWACGPFPAEAGRVELVRLPIMTDARSHRARPLRTPGHGRYRTLLAILME